MKNRKTNILSASKELFNQHGYYNVTIRMIALALKISSGNLNYHFKKREDILEALYFEMVSEFDARVDNVKDRALSFKTLKEDVQLSMQRMVDYHFFWTDLYNLLQLNDKIKLHFKEVYVNRFRGYQWLFSSFIEKGLLQNFEREKERDFLIERMIGFSNTWIYNSHLYQEEINQNDIVQQANNLLGMLYPYLTDLGKVEFKNNVPDFF